MLTPIPWQKTLGRSYPAVFPLPGFSAGLGITGGNNPVFNLPNGQGLLVMSLTLYGDMRDAAAVIDTAFHQNTVRGFQDEPTLNLCGFRTYRRSFTTYSEKYQKYGAPNLEFGITKIDRKGWSFDSNLSNKRPIIVDLSEPTGYTSIPGGSLQSIPAGYGPAANQSREAEVISVSDKKLWVRDSPEAERRLVGKIELTEEITPATLTGVINQWRGYSRDDRAPYPNSIFGGSAIGAARATDSSEGKYLIRSAFFTAWKFDMSGGQPALPLLDVEVQGYDAPYKLKFQTQTRLNQPVVVDNFAERFYDRDTVYSGDEIYNERRHSVRVTEQITEKIWRDERGIFDVDAAEETFSRIGWRAAYSDEPGVTRPWMGDLARFTGVEGVGQDAAAEFISADGGTYNLTVELGYVSDLGEGTWVSLETQTINIPPTTPVFLQFARVAYVPELSGEYETLRVRRIELETPDGYELVGGRDYDAEDKPAAKTMSDLPGEHVAILALSKSRKGTRWGHPAENATPEDTLDDNPTAPRFKKKRYELRYKASSN